jgi:hypothetical protein
MCIMDGWRYGRVDPMRHGPRIGERDDLKLDAINEVVKLIAAFKLVIEGHKCLSTSDRSPAAPTTPSTISQLDCVQFDIRQAVYFENCGGGLTRSP